MLYEFCFLLCGDVVGDVLNGLCVLCVVFFGGFV